jgi:hypothetical protein
VQESRLRRREAQDVSLAEENFSSAVQEVCNTPWVYSSIPTFFSGLPRKQRKGSTGGTPSAS